MGTAQAQLAIRQTRYGVDVLKKREAWEEAVRETAKMMAASPYPGYKGEFFSMPHRNVVPKPVQRPHPPLCIGGLGERRTLRTVARLAQHWNLPLGSPEVFKQKRDVLAGHCADIGRDPAEITTSVHIRLPKSGDIGPLVDEAAAYADAGMDLGIVYLPPPHTPAVLEPVAQALRPLAG